MSATADVPVNVEPTAPVEAPIRPSPGETGVDPDDRADHLPETVIEKRQGWQLLDLKELWRYRELLLILTWRDVQVRYKQSVLGASWAVLQPLATMIVFSLFLGRRAGVASGDCPYPLFVFSGLLPWFFFQGVVTSASQSVVGNQSLVTKVYFPRLLIPLSAAGAPLLDLAVASVLLLAMMLGYGVLPSSQTLLVPVVVALLGVAALGAGTLLAALTVAYRDFKHVVPFGVQLWMFATPSVYLAGSGSPLAEALLPLNPAYGLVGAFRAVMLSQEVNLPALATSAAVSLVMAAVALAYFKRVERSFADII